MSPKFSVIIPAYNQGSYLAQAVQSVLDQTFQDFEILVVNDASTDDTAAVMTQLSDPRVIRLNHPQNRGLPAARNTGIAAASGEWIALLDADDFYHPRKFEAHLHFLNANPDVRVTYNSRFELQHSSLKVRTIYQPPATVQLEDLVLGYPIAPSDMILHRAAIEQVGLFDERRIYGGEDGEFNQRLALAGYSFFRVEGVLNYRRYHAGRKYRHLKELIQFNTRTLDSVFADPRCPSKVLALRPKAYAAYYMEVACFAYAQGDFDQGLEFLDEVFRADPSAAEERPSRLVEALFTSVINDETLDHETLLTDLFEHLPAVITPTAAQRSEFIQRGYLIKGTQSALWGDAATADTCFRQAARHGARIDAAYRGMVASQLGIMQNELGEETAAASARQLFVHLKSLAGAYCIRQIKGQAAINQAFASYRSGDTRQTLRLAAQTVSQDPSYLSNRGLLAMTARSGWKYLIGVLFKDDARPSAKPVDRQP